MAVFIISWKPTDIEPKVLVHRETKYTCTWNGKHMSWQVSGSPGQRLRIIRARWESSSCVVLRAPQTIGNHTHELSVPIHGQRGRKRVSVGRGTDSVKEGGDLLRIETDESLSASPSVKGHLVSPVQSPFHTLSMCLYAVWFILVPLVHGRVPGKNVWILTLSSKEELLGCRLGVFIVLCNIWPLAPKWLDPHLRFEDVVTQKPLFLSP